MTITTNLQIDTITVKITTAYGQSKFGGLYSDDKTRTKSEIEIIKDGEVIGNSMARCRPETCAKIREVIRQHKGALGIAQPDEAALAAVDASYDATIAAMTLDGRSE